MLAGVGSVVGSQEPTHLIDLIEDGKLTAPVKNATLIGIGPEAMKNVSRVGNDPELDPGIGTCGKDGQSVPVGVGMPTVHRLRGESRRRQNRKPDPGGSEGHGPSGLRWEPSRLSHHQ